MQLQYVVGTSPAEPSEFDWGSQRYVDIVENESLERFTERVQQQEGLDKTDRVPCRLHVCHPRTDGWVYLTEMRFTALTPDHRLYIEAVDGKQPVTAGTIGSQSDAWHFAALHSDALHIWSADSQHQSNGIWLHCRVK